MATLTARSRTGPMVDIGALKTNQAFIVSLVVIAFVLGADSGVWVVAFVAVALAIGVARPGYGPFQLLYREALRPLGVVKARPEPGDAAPHRFAQTLGTVFLTVAAIGLFAGVTTVGWVLAWIVVALALVNLLFGFCAGCFIFLHLRRLTSRPDAV